MTAVSVPFYAFNFWLPGDPVQAGPENTVGQNLISPEGTVIRAPRVGIDSRVIFPTSTILADLTQALNQGVVHYPLSALPEDFRGNVFLFGHSSAKAYEANPARTAFTNLDRLIPGDRVEIWRQERVYVYQVSAVRILRPGEAEVYLASDSRKLTLSTCWPIGDPSRRFIVEADFVRSFPQRSYGSEADSSS